MGDSREKHGRRKQAENVGCLQAVHPCRQPKSHCHQGDFAEHKEANIVASPKFDVVNCPERENARLNTVSSRQQRSRLKDGDHLGQDKWRFFLSGNVLVNRSEGKARNAHDFAQSGEMHNVSGTAGSPLATTGGSKKITGVFLRLAVCAKDPSSPCRCVENKQQEERGSERTEKVVLSVGSCWRSLATQCSRT